MWKLEVSHNMISSIPSMAFYGLERALWELHLNNNRLIRVPADSITLLKKLAVLNLAGKKLFESDIIISSTYLLNPISVPRLGYFWKFFATKLLTKEAPTISTFLKNLSLV